MSYADLIINFITSSAIIGIATYLIQKKVDTRFSKIEEFQKTLISVKKEKHDIVLKAVHEIWEKIIDTEVYIRQDLPEQFKKAQNTGLKDLVFDSTPLKSAHTLFEKKSILLSESLNTDTKQLFITYFQNTFNGYINILNEATSGHRTLEEANNYIPNALGITYKLKLAELKRKFEIEAKEILNET